MNAPCKLRGRFPVALHPREPRADDLIVAKRTAYLITEVRRLDPRNNKGRYTHALDCIRLPIAAVTRYHRSGDLYNGRRRIFDWRWDPRSRKHAMAPRM
jgi:hypothetical protein